MTRQLLPLIAGENDFPESCEECRFGDEAGLMMMTNDSKVARFSTYEPGFPTAEGVQVGDSASRVHRLYGARVERAAAPYGDGPAHDLYVWRTKTRGLRFEVDDKGVVRAIHVGTDAICYMEGCL